MVRIVFTHFVDLGKLYINKTEGISTYGEDCVYTFCRFGKTLYKQDGNLLNKVLFIVEKAWKQRMLFTTQEKRDLIFKTPWAIILNMQILRKKVIFMKTSQT